MKKLILYTFLLYCLASCSIGAGTLGGFEERTFPIAETRLESAIDTLLAQHPEYLIPAKWEELDNWEERGYDFLNGKIFYFSREPEEMYFVTLIPKDNSQTSAIAIRAVNNGGRVWQLEDSFNASEKKRILNRFDAEIIVKLENISSVKPEKE